MSDLLFKKAISESKSESGEFISNIFVVEKKNGKFRPVINLRGLNEFIQYHHFKMETLETVLSAVKRNSFFVSIDLKDAYLSVPIFESDRKYLKFIWNGRLYQCNALIFGLASAPRVFTKIMKPVFAFLRQQGISSFYYIDDSLIQAETYISCKQHADYLVKLLEKLGFFVNREKSMLVPSSRILYLGHIIDSVEFKVYLPDEKTEKIIGLCEKLLQKRKLLIREIARLIGLFTSSMYAVNLAALYFRYLDRDKVNALRLSNNDYDGEILLSEFSKSEIIWWKDNVKGKNGKWIRLPKIDIYLETDASKSGWGANLDGVTTGGRWTQSESLLHINLLELMAVKFALQRLCHDLKHIHICIRSDNSSAVCYINNQGGSVMSLFEVAKDIWLWCDRRNIAISAVHIAGKNNFTADFMSRSFSDSTEWKLNEEIFQAICSHTFYPDIDLFASRLNKQLDRYISWFPDPHAITSDAFSVSWTYFKPYIFPPFSLIGKILQKLEEDKVRKAILIIPKWGTQTWYPKLLGMLVANPIQLPVFSDLLR